MLLVAVLFLWPLRVFVVVSRWLPYQSIRPVSLMQFDNLSHIEILSGIPRAALFSDNRWQTTGCTSLTYSRGT